VTRLGGENANRLLVQMPGVEDPSRVKRVIQARPSSSCARRSTRRTAGAVHRRHPRGRGRPVRRNLPRASRSCRWRRSARSSIPTNRSTRPDLRLHGGRETAVISGSDLQNAQPSRRVEHTVVSFSLRVGAADRFGNFTREHIGKQMRSCWTGRSIGAGDPAEIRTNGQIEGNFTPRGRRAVLSCAPARCGPHPDAGRAHRRSSLGRDSIREACGRGGSARSSPAFSCWSTTRPRHHAIVALALNMLILFAAMARWGPR